MEKFYLGLILRNGDILHNPFATTHEDLEYKFEEETKKFEYFKVTYVPQEMFMLHELDNYKLIIDEVFIPDWFNDSMRDDVVEKFKKIIKSMFVLGKKKILLNEGAILLKKANIEVVKGSIIFGMYDASKINVLDYNSAVNLMTDKTLIKNMVSNSKVLQMFGASKIENMRDRSMILKMYGDSNVTNMRNRSKIDVLKGGANIEEMRNFSKTKMVKHMSRVEKMFDHSYIEEMWDWSIVAEMHGNSQINYMDDDSKVLEMRDNSVVNEMYGESVVQRLYENSLVRKINDKAKIIQSKLK